MRETTTRALHSRTHPSFLPAPPLYIRLLGQFAALGLIAVGVLLLIATYAEMAFGANVPTIGFYFTSVGGIMMCTANCAVYGTRNHNKFCLFIHLIVVLTLFVVLVFAAVSLMGTINFDPVLDLDFQDRCMRVRFGFSLLRITRLRNHGFRVRAFLSALSTAHPTLLTTHVLLCFPLRPRKT